MNRKVKFISMFMVLALTTSCGRTVMLTGQNEISIPEPVTTVQTTAVPETAVQPVTTAVPEKVKIDTSMPDGYKLKKSFVIDGFRTVMQEPELPTGCEITALTQTMNYYGFDVDKVELCDVFMPMDFDGYYTMNEVYLGDPHSTTGFGCNPPVIVNVANDYFEYIGSDWYAVDLSGSSFEEVLYQVEQGRPVVIWTTIGQRETHSEFYFTLGCGEDFYFNPYQHCVTIYGFDCDKGIVNIADPLADNIEYDMERFRRIYDIMEQKAVILAGNEKSAGKVYSTAEEQKKWLEENRPEEDEEPEENVSDEDATEGEE